MKMIQRFMPHIILGTSMLASGLCSNPSASDLISNEVTETKLALHSCGISDEQTKVEYVDELQSVEAVIQSTITDSEQFECLDEISGHPIITFVDPTSAQRFSDFRSKKHGPEILRQVQQGLAEDGLLEGLPMPSSSRPTRADVDRLAQHCGLKVNPTTKGHILIGEHQYRFAAFDDGQPFSNNPQERKALSCFSAATKIWGAQHDVEVYLIGNEAPAEESE